MGTSKSAVEKINYFKVRFEAAKREGISIDKEQLIAQFIITQYSTRRKALEIINVFETAGIIKILGKEIASPELINENTDILPSKQKSLTEGI